jgi:hypothetical protein
MQIALFSDFLIKSTHYYIIYNASLLMGAGAKPQHTEKREREGRKIRKRSWF